MISFGRVFKLSGLVAAASVSLASPASAADQLNLPHASVVKYAVGASGLVFLRNLNEVDTTWAGCCSNFWIDVKTDAGRAQFSAFLTAKAGHQRLSIYSVSKAGSSSQALIHVGDF